MSARREPMPCSGPTHGGSAPQFKLVFPATARYRLHPRASRPVFQSGIAYPRHSPHIGSSDHMDAPLTIRSALPSDLPHPLGRPHPAARPRRATLRSPAGLSRECNFRRPRRKCHCCLLHTGGHSQSHALRPTLRADRERGDIRKLPKARLRQAAPAHGHHGGVAGRLLQGHADDQLETPVNLGVLRRSRV